MGKGLNYFFCHLQHYRLAYSVNVLALLATLLGNPLHVYVANTIIMSRVIRPNFSSKYQTAAEFVAIYTQVIITRELTYGSHSGELCFRRLLMPFRLDSN